MAGVLYSTLIPDDTYVGIGVKICRLAMLVRMGPVDTSCLVTFLYVDLFLN